MHSQGTLIRLHSVITKARMAELRRGVTNATILSLAISPSNDRLAVTSDTNTLHVFDLPTEVSPRSAHSSRSPTPEHARQSSSQSAQNKWGTLSKLPFAPRVFTDVYSIASTVFDPGTEREDDVDDGFVDVVSGVPGGTRTKGVAAWVDDSTIVVVNAGKDARYERFVLTNDRTGKIVCVRDGWSKYLVPG